MKQKNVDLWTILEEQYACTESYIQNLIALHNAIHRKNVDIDGDVRPTNQMYELNLNHVIASYQDANTKLFRCKRRLESLVNNGDSILVSLSAEVCPDIHHRIMQRTRNLLQDFLERSQRILNIVKRCGIRFHPNGIPMVARENPNIIALNERLTVALASLRASIRIVQTSLSKN